MRMVPHPPGVSLEEWNASSLRDKGQLFPLKLKEV
jgi:hypothetical protein